MTIYRSINALAESVNALYKTELHRNPAALAANGGHWRGLDDLEIATSGWVRHQLCRQLSGADQLLWSLDIFSTAIDSRAQSRWARLTVMP